jgi:CheY-like chemotaxis protein
MPRVLVVDDEPLPLQGFKRALRGHAEVVATSSFEEARRLFERRERFDALVLDVLLDKGTGLDLLAFARAHGYATTPAILVTGRLQPEWINPAQALGADWLTKPFPPEQLREFVRGAANARPVTMVEVRSRGSLQACIDELRKLVDGPQDWRVRHAIGEIAKDLKAHPERFGPHAIALVARALGIDRLTLYRAAKVAERWTLEQVGALLASKMQDGRLLSWKHVVALAWVESDAARDVLLQRTLDECLAASAVEDATAAGPSGFTR